MEEGMTLGELVGDEAVRRREFPIVQREIFLANAAICPFPNRVGRAMRGLVDRAVSRIWSSMITLFNTKRRGVTPLPYWDAHLRVSPSWGPPRSVSPWSLTVSPLNRATTSCSIKQITHQTPSCG